MSEIQRIQNDVWDLFSRPTPRLKATFEAAVHTFDIFARRRTARVFSAFDPDQVEEALRTAEELMRVADSAPGTAGLDAAATEFRRRLTSDVGRQNPALVYYAMQVFITHHPKGRVLTEAIPPLALREPEKVAPSGAARVAVAFDALGGAAAQRPAGVLPARDGLEWYREDPFANEHHEHWHVVYPIRGIPDGKGGRKSKDRHGELFFYMHQQMLARYDVERLAVGKPPVAAFADYRERIAEGYDPGSLLEESGFSVRREDLPLRDITDPAGPYTLADQETRRERFRDAIQTGVFAGASPPVPVNIDRLGATLEPNVTTVSPPIAGVPRAHTFYGNHHGMGHILAGRINDPSRPVGADNPPGVMYDPATTIRDPFFYRWHRHVDDLFHAWQERQPPNDFSDRPYASVRKDLDAEGRASSRDLILARLDALPEEARGDLQGWAGRTFGGDRWDEDFSAGEHTTDTLLTRMARRELVLSDRVTKVSVEHLVHDEFAYFVRVTNQLDRHYTVTVRLFLVPVEKVDDRRWWIELDKFLHELKPLERAVIARRGSESSVIRKPARMEPELLKGWRYAVTDAVLETLEGRGVPAEVLEKLAPLKDRVFENEEAFGEALAGVLTDEEMTEHAGTIAQASRFGNEKPLQPLLSDGTVDPLADEARNYCTCGWPYNLLLPRGTEGGMGFRLLVVLTDWDLDRVGPEGCCGSVSFCGAVDRYPDKRPMGYPFDRPFELGITETVRGQPNMAFRDITLRHVRGE
ncbi:MAG TPA: tyrosinase family protein [Longimicrobium sp.]|nr:tyrosinase family protein [Longimicrobium sp.]